MISRGMNNGSSMVNRGSMVGRGNNNRGSMVGGSVNNRGMICRCSVNNWGMVGRGSMHHRFDSIIMSFTFIGDLSNVSRVTLSVVGHNLGSAIGKGNTVRS